MEYTVSAAEIRRRKLAYLALVIGLIIGTFLASIIYRISISLIVYVIESATLTVIGLFSLYFFKKISTLKIILSQTSLHRKLPHSTEKYPLAKIKKVKIKWTTHRSIREIYIWMNDGKSIFLTGLNQFEKFRKDLLPKLNQQVTVREWREPLDFDSLFFYPILGLLISNLSILGFKQLITLSPQQLKSGFLLFKVYLLILGGYFILATPISKRSGHQNKIQDYLLGIVMISLGFISFLSLN